MSNAKKDIKPQLHVSMLNTMSTCGLQFQRRYGLLFGCWHKEEIMPPGIALMTGISVHKAVEKDLNNKINSDSSSLLPREEVIQIAHDSFNNQWMAGEVLLTDDEAANVKKTRGSSIDMTCALAGLHHDNIAPMIDPVAVEEKFVIEMPNYPFDLAGAKDVREKDGTIRDTKTKNQTPPDSAAKTIQNTMYSLSEKVRTKKIDGIGKLPPKVCLDFLIKNKTPKTKICEAVPDESWMKPLYARIEQAIMLIQSVKEGKGYFTPANPDSWMCSTKYCGFASTCKFYSGE